MSKFNEIKRIMAETKAILSMNTAIFKAEKKTADFNNETPKLSPKEHLQRDFSQLKSSISDSANFSDTELYGVNQLRGRQYEVDFSDSTTAAMVHNVAKQYSQLENIDYETAVVRTTNALIAGEDLI